MGAGLGVGRTPMRLSLPTRHVLVQVVVGLEEVKCIAAIYNHTASSPYTCHTLWEIAQSDIHSFGLTTPPNRQHGPLRIANNLPL
jgi:hypothetical protein